MLSAAASRRWTMFGRLCFAALVLVVARYSVWFVHEQHMQRDPSVTAQQLWVDEPNQLCRMKSMHDELLDLVQPAHAYFERFPSRRTALVQLMTTLESILLLFNVWLFVVQDAWVIVQFLAAFCSVLGLQLIYWTPMPCGASVLNNGAAWLSDLLAGGNAVLPLGGVSGSTVFVTIALYNVWLQRRYLDTACLVGVTLTCYSVYHLVMRWHYGFDEIASILLGAVIVHQVQRARAIGRLRQVAERLHEHACSLRVSTVSTPRALTPAPSVYGLKSAPVPVSLQQAQLAYQTQDQLETMTDEQFDVMQEQQLPARGSLDEISIYHPH